MTRAGIILCGGLSSRMGQPKALLAFGDETMLQRVVRLVSEVCRPIVVVAAVEQELPALPSELIVVRDRAPQRGPLEGIAAGLAALPPEVDAAYITGCDVPLVKPAFILRMFELLGEESVAVPVSGGFQHPLSAVYRPSVLPIVEQMLAMDRLRPGLLFDTVATRRVSEAELRDVDPGLDSLRNINRPEDYQSALASVAGKV